MKAQNTDRSESSGKLINGIDVDDSKKTLLFSAFLFLYQLSQPFIGEIGMGSSEKLLALNNCLKEHWEKFFIFIDDLIGL
jgi:hypothetical protein